MRGSDEVDDRFVKFRETRSDNEMFRLKDQVEVEIRSSRASRRRRPSILWRVLSPLLILTVTAVILIMLFGAYLVIRDYIIPDVFHSGQKTHALVMGGLSPVEAIPVAYAPAEDRKPAEHRKRKQEVTSVTIRRERLRKPSIVSTPSDFTPRMNRHNLTTPVCSSCAVVSGVGHAINGTVSAVQSVADPVLQPVSQLVNSVGKDILAPLLRPRSAGPIIQLPSSDSAG
jgi:hypothetical protein